jgi:hypothetical protein
MERSRSQRTEVAGLPVFLVLAKCDLLAGPTDRPGDWMDRIEQRKHEVGVRFKAFMAQSSAEEPLPFGRIDLFVWATAVKRPALVGTAARPREPYMVAELFRQCLDEAQSFRHQERRSGRRLWWTVLLTGGLLAGMSLTGTGLLMLNRSAAASALLNQVEEIRYQERGGPAERLGRPLEQLQRLKARLEEIAANSQFSTLPEPQRQFVTSRLEELREYIPYLEKIQAERRPGSARTERDLSEMRDRFLKELALPRPEWADTEAGKLHQQMLAEVEALQKAVREARNRFLDEDERAGKLWTFADFQTSGPEAAGIDWGGWALAVEKLPDPARGWPFSPADVIPGTTTPLTYAVALRFERVLEARLAYESDRTKLRRLLNLTTALGLAPASRERSAVLVIPPEFTLDQTRPRLEQLKKDYPEYEKDFSITDLADAVKPVIRQSARGQYANLLKPGQAEVLRQLKQAGTGSEETAARWQAVREWLRDPAELAAWRELARILVRLDDPRAEDPVDALATFLKQSRFTIQIRTLTLEIPERLVRPRADARLRVLHPASERQPALALEPTGEPRRDARRRWIYTYRLAEGEEIYYRPGEKFWAALALRDGEEMVWGADPRSQLYQFERLRLPPRAQERPGMALNQGKVLEGVQVLISPESGLPRVPDLLPAVRLD